MTTPKKSRRSSKKSTKKVLELESFFDDITAQYCFGTGADIESMEHSEWAHVCRVTSILLHLRGVKQMQLD